MNPRVPERSSSVDASTGNVPRSVRRVRVGGGGGGGGGMWTEKAVHARTFVSVCVLTGEGAGSAAPGVLVVPNASGFDASSAAPSSNSSAAPAPSQEHAKPGSRGKLTQSARLRGTADLGVNCRLHPQVLLLLARASARNCKRACCGQVARNAGPRPQRPASDCGAGNRCPPALPPSQPPVRAARRPPRRGSRRSKLEARSTARPPAEPPARRTGAGLSTRRLAGKSPRHVRLRDAHADGGTAPVHP